MIKYIYLSLTLLVLKVTCLFREGPCPSLSYGNMTFDMNRYMGDWFEAARLKNDTLLLGRCVMNNLMMNDDGTFNLTLTQTLPTAGLDDIISSRITPSATPFLFNATFFNSAGPTNIDYYVLSTDYTNYLIDYTCINIDGGRDENLHILFRNKDFSMRKFRTLLDYLRDNFNITKDLVEYTRLNC